jgi:hypothetical protein
MMMGIMLMSFFLGGWAKRLPPKQKKKEKNEPGGK